MKSDVSTNVHEDQHIPSATGLTVRAVPVPARRTASIRQPLETLNRGFVNASHEVVETIIEHKRGRDVATLIDPSHVARPSALRYIQISPILLLVIPLALLHQ